MLEPGTEAPEIDLLDARGQRFRLSELRGIKNAVVYFYTADNTPVCTRQACAFRDAYEEFTDSNTEVIGISAQSVGSHQHFATKNALPFVLLSDIKREAQRAYDVKGFLGLLAGRITYVIDRSGVIRAATSDQFRGPYHVRKALQALRDLPAGN